MGKYKLFARKLYKQKNTCMPDDRIASYAFANIKKAKQLLNWKPMVDIKKGVKCLLKEINYWRDAPVWTAKKIEIATKDWFKYLK